MNIKSLKKPRLPKHYRYDRKFLATTMSCTKTENRTGCQNGPSSLKKLRVSQKWNDGRDR